MKHSRLISLLFLIIALKSNAQLTGWPYRSVIQINENSGDTLFNYQVRLTLNTADSIAAGRFTPACSDLVFAKYCNGGVVYPHWIESAVNTPATVIWVRIDTLLPNSARNIYLFYGNTTNPSFSNFFITFPSRKIVSSNETVTDTVWNYDWVEIYSGDTATLSPVNRPGKLTINARKILINGVLNATGAGYKGGITGNGDGPGGGKLSSTLFGGGGGAAYGGAGGVGCGGAASGGAGGFVYGSSSAQNIEPGSGGAPPGNLSAGGYGGDGGGSVTLNATSIEVNDLIRTDGTEGDGGGSYSAGGGGSGGGILINGRHVSISGNLSAKGGKGADPNVAAPNHYGGGGGAGGRIKIFYDKSYSHTGINLLNGGVAGMCNSNSGQSGAAGTFHTGTYASGYPTVSVPSAQVSFGNFSFSTAGLIASFTDQTSSSSSWSWDFGDGSTDNTKNPQHVYTQEGTYNVCLTVTAPCGTDQVCKQVIVTSPATAWKYKSAVNIQENSSKQLVNYQIRISLNTMDTIAAGRMKTDCSDLRFARNCDGSGLLDYWIESGANTTGTLIWIKLDTLKPGQTKTVYMLYGNPAAAAQSSFSSTFPNNRIITGPLAVPDTVWNYDWVEIAAGATVTLSSPPPSKLVINARKIKIDGTLDASGLGHLGGVATDGNGPGGGKKGAIGGGGGGGAGYGANGGAGASGGAGGGAYGTASSAADIAPGSGGGPASWVGSGVAGGNGGGMITLAGDIVEVSGTVKVNANNGNPGTYSGGGGSGGGILIRSDKLAISNTALLAARGGDGGLATHLAGGGGAGGRIKLYYDQSYLNTGTVNINGGAAGSGCCTVPGVGGNGSFYAGLYASGIPTYTYGPAYSGNADFTYTPTGLNVSFTDLTPSATSWTWDFGDGSGSSVKNPGHTYASEGAYNVCLTVSTPSCLRPRCRTISTATSGQTFGSWRYRVPLEIKENANTGKADYQVLLTLDALNLVNAGKMQENSEDLRFGNCDMSTLYDHYIESGQKTSSMKVWVRLDTLPPNDTVTIFMFYGNPDAVSASSFDNTFPPATRLEVSAGSTAITGNNTYSWVEVASGASLVIGPNSPTTITARKIRIAGTIDANGAGFAGAVPTATGSGPGGGQGQSTSPGGGGGGYGGRGGKGAPAGTTVGNGGPVYGSQTANNIEMGSGGGGSTTLAGGNGGGAVTLVAEDIDIPGIISSNGNNGLNNAGLNGCSGGGSGGGVLVNAKNLSFSGSISARGGNGGNGSNAGGGGGGGRIKLFSETLSGTGTMSVNPGTNGNPAPQAGTTYTGTFTTNYPTFRIIPQLTITSSEADNEICSGSSITFTASPGFGTYRFLVNSTVVQNDTSKKLVISNLNDRDTLRVVASFLAGCPDTSNAIVTRVITVTPSDAGSDQAICNTTATLSANSPGNGTGEWSVISGTGVVMDSYNRNSDVNNLSPGTNTFRWTISKSGCSSSSEVTVTRDEAPSASDAGTDMALCADAYTLNGNSPATGTGVWSVINGSASLQDPADPNSGVSSLTYGDNTFRWTISNGVCPPSFSEITIKRYQDPDASVAGADQAFCSASATLSANTPVSGTGEWSIVSGGGTLDNVNDPASSITGLPPGETILKWTISNGPCTPSESTMKLRRDLMPDLSDVGADQSVCTGSISLSANTPVNGTGQWSVINGGAGLDDPQDPSTLASGLSLGTNTFRWTISNGTCPPDFSEVTITRTEEPGPVFAGADKSICADNIQLGAATPLNGSGTWSVESGAGTLGDASDPTSTVSALGYGPNVFRWTVSNGICPPVVSEVTITRDTLPTAASAGPNQALCADSALLAGNQPLSGNGTWSVVSGSALLSDVSDPSATARNLPEGITVLRWTVENGACPSSVSEVSITRYGEPSASDAGPDQQLCNQSAAFLSANSPSAGTGTWTSLGSGTVSDPSDPASSVTGLTAGANTFRWTVSSGNCPPSVSEVVIFIDTPPSPADAGPDQQICSSQTTLGASIPASGSGSWSVVSGTLSLTDPLDPLSDVSNISTGQSILRWTISNGTCISESDVTITRDEEPTQADAGPDRTVCSPGTALSASLPLTGTGTWSVVSGSGAVSDPSDPGSAITNLTPGEHVFSWSVTNGTCPPSVSSVKITRIPDLAGGTASPPIQSVCEGNSFSIALQGASWGTSIQWQDSVAGGSWTNITASNSSILTRNAMQPAFYRAKIYNGSCPDVYSSVASVSADKQPDPGTASPDRQICSGSSATVSVSGYSGQLKWQTSPDMLTASDSAGTGGPNLSVSPSSTRYYRVKASSGTCSPAYGNWIKVSVTAPPAAGVLNSPADICKNDSAMLSLSGHYGTISWQSSGDGIYFSNLGLSGNPVKLSPDSRTIYRALVSNGACPSDTSNPVTVNVHQPVNGGSASASPTVLCAGNSINVFLSGYSGNVQWESSADGISNWQDIPLATSVPLNQSPSSDIYYRAVCSNGFCPDSYSNTVYIKVLPGVTANGSITASPVCPGNTATLVSGSAEPFMQWQYSSDNLSWWNVPGAQTGTFTTPALFSTSYYRLLVSNGACSDTSNPVKVEVLPSANAGVVSNSAAICEGSSLVISASGANGSLQWQSSNDGSIFTDIFAASNPSLNISPATKTWYRLIADNGMCPDTSSVIEISVDWKPLAGSISGNSIVCAGTSSSLKLSGFMGAITWQDSLTSWNSLPGSLPVLNISPQGTSHYRAIVTNGVCPAAVTGVFTLSTVPASVPGVISTFSNPVCADRQLTLTLEGSLGTIQWQAASDLFIGWMDVPGKNQPQYTDYAGANRFFRARVTNGTCPPAYSAMITIQSVPAVVAGTVTPATGTVCAGGSAELRAEGYNASIRWQISADNSSWEDIPGLANNVYITPPVSSTLYVRTIAGNGICADTSAAGIIRAGSIAPPGEIEGEKTVCKGGEITLKAADFIPGKMRWQLSADNSNFTDLGHNSGEITVSPLSTSYYRIKSLAPGCPEMFSPELEVKVSEPGGASTIYPAGESGQIFLVCRSCEGEFRWQISYDSTGFSDIPGAKGYMLRPTEKAFYRVEFTGNSCHRFSNSIRVTDLRHGLTLSPVPAEENVRLSFYSQTEEIISFQVYDALGQFKLSGSTHTRIGSNAVDINISQLAAGSYYIKLDSETFGQVGKIIKK